MNVLRYGLLMSLVSVFGAPSVQPAGEAQSSTARETAEVTQAADLDEFSRLEEDFASEKDRERKLSLASQLMILGKKSEDHPYADYLIEQASLAVEVLYEIPCNFMGREIDTMEESPAFAKYASNLGLSSRELFDQVSEYTQVVSRLALSRDPRGFDVFKRGVRSRNCLLQAVAAMGLEAIGDAASAEALIAAGKSHPHGSSERAVIALCLAGVDGERAQKFAEEWMESHAQFKGSGRPYSELREEKIRRKKMYAQWVLD